MLRGGWMERVLNHHKAHYKHGRKHTSEVITPYGYALNNIWESRNKKPASPTALKPEIILKQYENRFK